MSALSTNTALGGLGSPGREERREHLQTRGLGLDKRLCVLMVQEETKKLSSLWKSWRNKGADLCEGVWQSKPSPPLLSAHFPAESLLAQETDGKKHSCLNLIERECQVKYFLHTDDGSEPKIHPGLCCYICIEWGEPNMTVPLHQNDISSFQRNKFAADCTYPQPYNFSHLISRGNYSFSGGTVLP